ncbi:calmodulin-binding transcription activator 4-like isoform X1 [Zingiber officinale]|uniref:calmodulin-binding transcription activator 4-like isoform X1 n=2 Tax=Zingiber officinale TaxID=94328 RepID=UPI001C4ACDDB|nr:calmodulin-binding transcription activator 4-like isoform X1 [Zingiber officinale]
MQQDFDINKLSQEAQIRWLKPVEVLYILQKHEKLKITERPPQKPPSGSLFLFNRRVLRYFRNDGHLWRKKTNGKTVREGHEHLKVGNSTVLNCYYAHGEQNSSFQRRSYWMLHPAFEHIVLVHYREVVEGRCMPESILSCSNDSCPTLRYGDNICDSQENFSSHATGFNDTGQNSKSPGSAEEVSSQLARRHFKISHLNKMDRSESSNILSLSEFNQALRKLEQQLSLDSDDDGLAFTMETSLPLSQVEALKHPPKISNSYPEDGAQPNDISIGSVGLEWLHSPFLQSYISEADDDRDIYNLPTQGTANAISVGNGEFPSFFSDTWFDQGQFEAPVQTESSLGLAEGILFKIHEISPEWGLTTESTKVVIIGDFCCRPSEYTWNALFGDIEVPLEIVRDGVFRCLAPAHAAGKVKLCITTGNKQPCSEIHEFEFHDKLKNISSRNIAQKTAMRTSEELLLLFKFVQLLLSENFSTTILQESNVELEVSPLRKLKGSNDRLDPIIQKFVAGSVASKDIMDAILQELLKHNLYHWLSFRHETDKYQFSKREQCIIHMIAGLGFLWALHPILDSGIGINYRDSDGWTALHWAAYFGREQMVAALLAAGASARAITNPSEHDPEGKTPASLAAANGYKGLAGYLSEAALTTHLFSLTTEKNERSVESASKEIDRGVESISQRSAILDGGTEDQLSLKDSLAAARNAVQAAARIQAAFRSYSLRKKQQKAALCQDGDILFPPEMHKVSVVSRLHNTFQSFYGHKFDKAVLLIQKNFRRWKIRKKFLLLRKHVVKIQSHVRAHLARKMYKELLSSVNFLDKAIMRWHRRGVGLRGFHAKPESIDEKEEDDIIKVFRKQKVDLATDQALSSVLSVVQSPKAQLQYRRMLESYQQAKADLGKRRK